VQVEDNNVFFSSARSMARFGLLILNNGNWNGTPVMTDETYFNAMINTSQELNKGYGYLWWLNGKENYMLPSVQITIPGSIMPNAPDDMVSGLGKDGQFVNVVPSQNLVLIRMGEEPTGSLVPFLMNDKIWEYMNVLICNPVGLEEEQFTIGVFPNPTAGSFTVQSTTEQGHIVVLDLFGRLVYQKNIENFTTSIDLGKTASGTYFVRLESDGKVAIQKIVVR
jgi:CubicO group peptidase (beta-lactamase class C family)